MKKFKFRNFMPVLLAVILVSGCAQTKTFESSGVHFYKSVPSVLSNVWTDGQDTYLVPSKGISHLSVSLESGKSIAATKSGSYFKVSGTHSHLSILVNGKFYQAERN